MIGGIDRQSAHVGVCQAIVDSCPGLTVIGGAKYAASLGTDEDVTTRICGERNPIAALWAVGLCPKALIRPLRTGLEALLLCNVPSWSRLPLLSECIAEYSQNDDSQEDKQTDSQM